MLIYEFDLAEGIMTVRSDYCAAAPGSHPTPMARRAFARPTTRWTPGSCCGGVPVQELLSDPDLDPASRRSMETWGEKSVLNVPFSFGDEPLGLLAIVETETERRFTSEEVELVRGIGEQAAVALHNAKVYRELEQRQRETELLNEIARKITSSLRVEDIAEATVAELRRLVPFDRASLVLIDERGMLVNVLAVRRQAALPGPRGRRARPGLRRKAPARAGGRSRPARRGPAAGRRPGRQRPALGGRRRAAGRRAS